jgi:hypothetical protein
MTSIFFAPLGAKVAHNINGKRLKKIGQSETRIACGGHAC